jgi:hypothetical protein
MIDPFELWLLAWESAVSHGMERMLDAIPGAAATSRPEPVDLSTFPVLGRVRIELPAMLLLEQRMPAQTRNPPVLIVGPYAVHDGSIGDFADGHSVAQVLSKDHFVALTFWKSADVQMRYYGIDAYLSDLNVAVDDLGGPPRSSACVRAAGSPLSTLHVFRGKSANSSLSARQLIRARPRHGLRACYRPSRPRRSSNSSI